jgi:hypothetical protein
MSSATRAITPPQTASSSSTLQLTPEQVKRVELNRLKGMFPWGLRNACKMD